MKIVSAIVVGIILMTVAGCGGGGGEPAPSAGTTATIKISTAEASASGASLSGVGFTLILPAGVTVATASGGSVADGVVVPAGVTSSSTASTINVYTPASGSNPGTLHVTVVSTAAAGFGIGEFINITVSYPPDTSPPAADQFQLSDFSPADLLEAPINGVTGVIAVQ